MKTRWIVILSILAVLILVRLAAPYFIRNRANEKLGELNGYEGTVEDVDLALFRGAVILDSVYFVKTGAGFAEPFMAVSEVEVIIDWAPLFRQGKWMTFVVINDAEINLLVDWADEAKTSKVRQMGKGVDWFKTFRELSPIPFNRIEVNESTLVYRDLTRDPEISTYLANIKVRGNNLQNPKKLEEPMPGEMTINAITEGGGVVDILIALDLLTKPMDLNMNLELEGMDLVEMNDFMRVYTGLDFESGNFNVYSEMQLVNGQIDGYVKPVIENLSLYAWGSERGDPFLDRVWEAIAGGLIEIFKNQKKDQLATQVTLTGSIEDPDADVLTAVLNTLKNAFIAAFEKEIGRE